MQKRGQFYLIAAFVIAGLIISLGAIFNYTRTNKENPMFYDLSEEIDFEVSRIIDRGVFFEEAEEQKEFKVKDITEYYAELNPDNELATIYGDASGFKVYYYYIDTSSESCVNDSCVRTLEKKFEEKIPIISGGNVIVQVRDDTFEFKLEQGENFYVVLLKEYKGEKFVAKT